MHSVVVISDLHIASGPLDDCDAELQHCFESFLEWLSHRNTTVELVLNGDFLDFVQAEPWSGSGLEADSDEGVPLCFTEEQSIAKLESIHAAHRAVFDALGSFLRSRSDNVVTVMPGNHDADFYWEGVRTRFREYVGCVDFFLDRVYRPTSFPSVWIEHGHQSDPVNCFIWKEKPCWGSAAPPIFKDRAGTLRLYECTGTRFLIRFMNRLDQEYPFVDNVKPFSRFVKIFGASAFVPNYGKMKVAVAIGRMLAYLCSTVMHRPGDVLSVNKETQGMVYEFLSQRFRTLPRSRLDVLIARMAERGFVVEKPLPMYLKTPAQAEPLLAFLSEHPDLFEELEIPGASFLGASVPGTLTLAKGFAVDETRELIAAAERALATEGVDLVLMGHTHEPVRKSARSYINTGCWTRYYRFDPDEKPVPWDVLQSDSYATFPYELDYAEILPGQASSTQLATYKERHA